VETTREIIATGIRTLDFVTTARYRCFNESARYLSMLINNDIERQKPGGRAAIIVAGLMTRQIIPSEPHISEVIHIMEKGINRKATKRSVNAILAINK